MRQIRVAASPPSDDASRCAGLSRRHHLDVYFPPGPTNSGTWLSPNVKFKGTFTKAEIFPVHDSFARGSPAGAVIDLCRQRIHISDGTAAALYRCCMRSFYAKTHLAVLIHLLLISFADLLDIFSRLVLVYHLSRPHIIPPESPGTTTIGCLFKLWIPSRARIGMLNELKWRDHLGGTQISGDTQLLHCQCTKLFAGQRCLLSLQLGQTEEPRYTRGFRV